VSVFTTSDSGLVITSKPSLHQIPSCQQTTNTWVQYYLFWRLFSIPSGSHSDATIS
jgi:hypothetical protein